MVWFKEKNVGDAPASARLLDAEPGDFDPTRTGSALFFRIFVEISSLSSSQIDRFRLNPIKLVSCAGQFPIESRP